MVVIIEHFDIMVYFGCRTVHLLAHEFVHDGVDRYTVHMTILSPIGQPIFACFMFRYRFHILEDLLRESLDLCHDFSGLYVVLSFCCLLLMFF